MPNIEEISVTYSRKVQLEQFEPIEHRVTLEAEVEDDENAGEAYDELADEAEDMVERSIAERTAAKKLGDDADDA